MRGILVSALIGVAIAGCLGSSGAPPGSAGTAGTTGQAGTTGTGAAGTTGMAGSTGMAGTGGPGGTTGMAGTTGSGGTGGPGGTTGVAGTMGSGGTGELGMAGTTGMAGTMGMAGTGMGGGRAGTTGMGGMMTGRGGSMGAAGTMGTAGTTGMAGNTGTAGFFPKPLRVDDTCGTLQGGNTCLHQGKTSDNGTPYTGTTPMTVGGTPGTMYTVKIHIRGVVEPTHINGGTAGTPVQFVTGGSAYADTTNEGTYQQWQLITPSQHYFLNVYNADGLSHVVHAIDYTQTIMLAGGSMISLQVHDGNSHAISNTNGAGVEPTGCSGTTASCPGSMNGGQFIQIEADSAM